MLIDLAPMLSSYVTIAQILITQISLVACAGMFWEIKVKVYLEF